MNIMNEKKRNMEMNGKDHDISEVNLRAVNNNNSLKKYGMKFQNKQLTNLFYLSDNDKIIY